MVTDRALRRRRIVLVAAVISAALMARLGFWQLDRAAQKNSLQAARSAQAGKPALQTRELAATAEQAPAQWDRQAAVQGRWLVDNTVYLDNRSMNGRVGFFVVTPLLLDDGRLLAVQRGWLPRAQDSRQRIAPYQTPAEPVAVSGRIAPSASRLYELGSAGTGVIRQNLDLDAFARQLRRPLLPLVLIQDDADTTSDGLSRQWPAPASDVHKHYGYAFQWFGLSGLVIALYVWFQVIRPRRPAAR